MSLEKLVLEVVRALAQTIESINGWLAAGVGLDGANYRTLTTASKLADRIEHIAQYALEGVDDAAQRRYLRDDIEFLSAFLTEYRDAICKARPWPLPTNDGLRILLSAAESPSLTAP
ncbi:hypothetical protein BJG93_34820 (plasmid) [Paraburkholderia sprentiae WSM5005]|uniref:Uncharacterized protein n=1 Tax=Paraburkholderia sprentiae WSM5005 TaxID=754502 RepID=A0ACA8AX39_9BURK|nr:hypothetical protein [Paraburkholderia sprentiae]APA90287.1 hypothetical protein BJG93_34820 [Paraburkholderia sprentiae WSM5005]